MTNEMCADGKYAKLSSMRALDAHLDAHLFIEYSPCKPRGGESHPD